MRLAKEAATSSSTALKSQSENTDENHFHNKDDQETAACGTLEQTAGGWGSERVVAGWDPHQQRVFMRILETEVLQVRSGLRHLETFKP